MEKECPIRVTFLRLSSLGDVIVGACVLPFVKAHLHKIYPQGVKICWIVDSMFSEILHHSPCIDEVVSINLRKGGITAIPRAIRTLKSLKHNDILIDMQGLIKSAICGAIMDKKEYWGFAWDSIKEPAASICYTHKVHIPYGEHILRRNFTLVSKSLGIQADEKQFYSSRSDAFGVGNDFKIQLEDIFTRYIYKDSIKNADFIYVLLVLEASLESKTYPCDLFIEVIKELLDMDSKIHILLLQHSTTKAQFIKKQFVSQERVSILPCLSISMLKILMQRLDLVIGGDTGITHLAWAMQRASITLYGNTPPQRFALSSPYNDFLCGNENPSYKKDDFSIANISPNEICAKAKKILCKRECL